MSQARNLSKNSVSYFFSVTIWPNMPIMGIWAYVKKYGQVGYPLRKHQKWNVDLRSVGPSVQKLWPTTFFAKKMPCILHGAEKKIRYTISSQVSGLAQLPDDLKFRVDQESNTYKSGGVTWCILSHSTSHHACWQRIEILHVSED